MYVQLFRDFLASFIIKIYNHNASDSYRSICDKMFHFEKKLKWYLFHVITTLGSGNAVVRLHTTLILKQ